MSKAQTPTVYAEQELLSSWSSKGFFFLWWSRASNIYHWQTCQDWFQSTVHSPRQANCVLEFTCSGRTSPVLCHMEFLAKPWGGCLKLAYVSGLYDLKGSQLFMRQREGRSLCFHEECLTSPCWVVIDCSVSSKSRTDSPPLGSAGSPAPGWRTPPPPTCQRWSPECSKEV